ncbi:hypothetical protein [Mycolicibacter virginiensis]|uniref:hypothetical protein n=1 Tax=Mycolicibacter virginiensis TaxID=1795032 RepID=UPI001F035319|nr:hypothetical protein [Mycolicibacter virginiensis]ULP45922.1 hypothetical protein MJO54_13685 [Mycolicibacter virginiensis]
MTGEKKVEVKDFGRFNRKLSDIEAAYAPLPDAAAEARRHGEEAAAGAAGATGSVAGAIAEFLTAVSGAMTEAADAADAAHAHLRSTTLDMRTWNGGLEAIQNARAANISATPAG